MLLKANIMRDNILIIRFVLRAALILLPVCLIGLPCCIYREYAVTQDYEVTEYRTEYTTGQQTENVSVAYTGNVEYKLTPHYYWNSAELYYREYYNVWYYGYDLPEYTGDHTSRLKLLFQPQLQYEKMYLSVFDMTGIGHIDYPDPIGPTGNSEEGLVDWTFFTGSATSTWLDQANSQLGRATFLGGRSNVWTNPKIAQIIELDAGSARTIAVIINGPHNKWNCDFSLSVVPVYYTTETRPLTYQAKTPQMVPYQVKKQRTIYEFRQIPFWELLFSR